MKANAGHKGYEGHQGNESHEGHESHYLYVWLKIVKRRALDHSLLMGVAIAIGPFQVIYIYIYYPSIQGLLNSHYRDPVINHPSISWFLSLVGGFDE